MSNQKFKNYKKQYAREDSRGPPKRFHVAVVTIKIACGTKGGGYEAQENSDGDNFFTVPLKHGLKYTLSVYGKWFIVVNSRARRCLTPRRGMFKSYTVLVNAFVYTASGKCIPVVGRGNVGGIPNYLRVPTLETNLLSVPHMDVTMK